MVIGIDLGTTYSVAAYVDKNGIAQVITNAEGEETTPSVVLVDGDIARVGKNAKQRAASFFHKICRCAKVNMGNRVIVLKDAEHEYSPEAISGLILKKIIQDSEKRLGQKIDGAVVTVPTYFDNTKRTATRHALESIVLEDGRRVSLVGIIDEPKAAALDYCYQSNKEDGKILVYDFGGGTFDATLLEVNGNEINILAEGEEHEAGGAYFDEFITNYVMDEVLKEYNINLREDKYSQVREEILCDAETCKIELSLNEESSIFVRCPQGSMDITVTRDAFNDLIENMVYRTIIVIEDMLDKKDIKPEEIDKVLLVGGSSQIPYVRQQLKDMFHKDLSEVVDPNKAVAYGAAIWADMHKNKEKEKENKLVLSDVTSHAIGLIRMEQSNAQNKINDILIPPNTPIPAEKVAAYETAWDNQRYIRLQITEGLSTQVEFVKVISDTEVEIPKDINLKRGTEVRIRFYMNENHLLEVYLEIPSIELNKKYEINRGGNLSEEEMRELSGLIVSKKIR